MEPLLRPGSTVLMDTTMRRMEDTEWSNEYDRPMYFVEIRNGYRCGWFQKEKTRLIMQPHALSRCAPEAWRTPEQAEVVGRSWEWSRTWGNCGVFVPQQFQKSVQIGAEKFIEIARLVRRNAT